MILYSLAILAFLAFISYHELEKIGDVKLINEIYKSHQTNKEMY